MSRLLLSLAWLLLAGVALAALLFGLSEHRLAVERAARVEVLQSDAVAAGQRIIRLEAELHQALNRAELVAREAAERREALERLIDETNQERGWAFKPIPDGVRLALRGIEEMLGHEGYDSFRFLRADRIEDHCLFGAELIETNPRDFRVAYYLADELRIRLDRSSAVLTLAMAEGHVVVDGHRQEFGDEGWSLVLERVDGPGWEERLPYLVQAEGEYPEEPTASLPRDYLDPVTRAEWQERVDGLLARAGTDVLWRLDRFDSLDGAFFTGCLVLGYRQQRWLDRSAEAARFAIEIDRRSDSVSLLLIDGILRQKAGNSSIPDSGYRILLPDLTAGDATDAMLGKVVERSR